MKISLRLSTISPDQEKLLTFCKKDCTVERFKIYMFQTVSNYYQPKKFHIKAKIVKIAKIAKYDPNSSILRCHFEKRYGHKILHRLAQRLDRYLFATGGYF